MIIKGNIRILRGLQANLPLLNSGELAVTTDTKKLYVGMNGVNEVLNPVTEDSGTLDYNDLINKPNLSPVATSGSYNDLTNRPNLSPVATSGNYNDLINKPSIMASLFAKGFEVRTEPPTGDDLYEGRCWVIGTPPPEPVAPIASNVSISGVVKDGQVVTGTYTYSDENGDVEGTSLFKWYLDTVSDGSSKVLIEDATNINYTVQVADVDKYLFFEVTPIAQTGTVTQGNPVISLGSIITSSVIPNTAPTAPVISESSVGDTSITIGLTTASTDAEDGTITLYNVYRGGVLHASDVTITQGSTYQLTGLTSGTQYDITLKAKDSVGELSVSSNTITAMTTVPNTAPTVPTGLVSSAITPTTFTLSWTASTDAEGNVITYTVYKNGTPYQNNISVTNLAITGQTASSNATWTVSATDGTLESAQSTGLSVTMSANPPTIIWQDTFEDGVIDATTWNVAEAGNTGAQVTETSGQLRILSQNAGRVAVHSKKAFKLSQDGRAVVKFTHQNPTSLNTQMIATFDHSQFTTSNLTDGDMVDFTYDTTNYCIIRRWVGATRYYWDASANQWTTSLTESCKIYIAEGFQYQAVLEIDKTNNRFRPLLLNNVGNPLFANQPSWTALSTFSDSTSDFYLNTYDNSTDYGVNVKWDEVRYETLV